VGSALAATGRVQAGGVQAASGTQTFPSVGQQPYPWRHCGSLVQDGMQRELAAIGVQTELVQSAGCAQELAQNPPSNPVVWQTSPVAQSGVPRQASPSALGGWPPGSTQVALTQRWLLGQSRTTAHDRVSLEQAARNAQARRTIASLVTAPPVRLV
jgi:hypothetical protein